MMVAIKVVSKQELLFWFFSLFVDYFPSFLVNLTKHFICSFYIILLIIILYD